MLGGRGSGFREERQLLAARDLDIDGEDTE